MIECLSCGAQRASKLHECPRCGYLGWAPTSALSESARRELREVPVGSRARRLVLLRG